MTPAQQRDPDIRGRLELAVAPGEIAVRIKALRVLAQDGDVEIGDQRLELGPRLHRPDIGEEGEVAPQIAARMPLDRIVEITVHHTRLILPGIVLPFRA